MTYFHIHISAYIWILPHEIPIQKDQSHGSTKIYQKISLTNGVPLNNLKPKDVELIKHHTAFRQISYSTYIYTCNAFSHLQAMCPSSLLFTAQREKNKISFLVFKPISKLLRKIEVKEIRPSCPWTWDNTGRGGAVRQKAQVSATIGVPWTQKPAAVPSECHLLASDRTMVSAHQAHVQKELGNNLPNKIQPQSQRQQVSLSEFVTNSLKI